MKRRVTRNGKLVRGKLTRADYEDAKKNSHAGNPMIEALPKIADRTALATDLANLKPYSDTERTLSHLDRIYLCKEILDHFEPLPHHLDLFFEIMDSIKLSMLHRNPIDSEYWIEVDADGKLVLESLESSQDFRVESIMNHPLKIAILLFGDSGMGKSTTVMRLLKRIPQTIIHTNYKHDLHGMIDGFIQLVWVYLEIPPNGSLRTLLLEFFRTVDSLLEFQNTDYASEYGGTVDVMLANFATVIGLHNIAIICIDELQRMVGSHDQYRTLRLFEALLNTAGVTVMLVGTESVYSFFSGDGMESFGGEDFSTFSSTRRMTGTEGLLDWKRFRENDPVYSFFLDSLWDYQYTQVETPLTDEIRQQMYHETQGVIDLLVKLYIMVQTHVIHQNRRTNGSKKEVITPELIHTIAAKGFKHLQSKLADMRMGKDVSLKPEDLRLVDVETFIEKYIQSYFDRRMRDLEMLIDNKSNKRGKSKNKSKSTPNKQKTYEVEAIPGGMLEAYRIAEEKKLSKYEVLKSRGFVHDPLSLLDLMKPDA